MSDDELIDCYEFRPDHNGECLNCDERIEWHTPEAIERGEADIRARAAKALDKQRIELVCKTCGAPIKNTLTARNLPGLPCCPDCGAVLGLNSSK